MNKIKIDLPIIVEGKYDKIKLDSIIDGQIIKTDGFSLFNSKETQEYIKRVAEKYGVIVLTDSDSGGLLIRNRLKSLLPKEKIIHLYPPQIEGKEKRKKSPSKEGYIGVEGLSADVIRGLFKPLEAKEKNNERLVTKTDLYSDGLLGGENSSKMRLNFKRHLNLPDNISSNALLDAINMLCSFKDYKNIIETINNESEG